MNTPKTDSPSGIEAEVCADIAARQREGISKYGTTVSENPIHLIAWLQHAYEECLDQAIYLKRSIREIENQYRSITCPQCGRTSYHPKDIKERYCGHCHQWHDDMEAKP